MPLIGMAMVHLGCGSAALPSPGGLLPGQIEKFTNPPHAPDTPFKPRVLVSDQGGIAFISRCECKGRESAPL